MSDALQRLIDAVEAGTLTGNDPTCYADGMIDLIESAGVCRASDWDDVALAHDGSLDAAKALHEALLGDGYIGNGYLYCIWGSGKASVWEIISGASAHADVPEKEHHAVSPARAWLLAILRAYQQVQQ